MSEIVESRLSKQDMTPEGGCSAAFKDSLKSFLDGYVNSLKRTWDTCESVESLSGMDDSGTTRKIIQNISSLTARQLEVLSYVFLVGLKILLSFFPFFDNIFHRNSLPVVDDQTHQFRLLFQYPYMLKK